MFAGLLKTLGDLDAAAFAAVRVHHWASLDAVMWFLTTIARAGVLWLMMGAVIASVRPGRWPAFFQLLLAIGLAGLLADVVLKPVLGRARPFETERELRVYGNKPGSPSFPSGHTATAFAGSAALANMLPQAAAGFWVLAGLVAFSRIYLGVHYPFDVLGGMLVGIAAASFVIAGTRWSAATVESRVRSSRARRRAVR